MRLLKLLAVKESATYYLSLIDIHPQALLLTMRGINRRLSLCQPSPLKNVPQTSRNETQA